MKGRVFVYLWLLVLLTALTACSGGGGSGGGTGASSALPTVVSVEVTPANLLIVPGMDQQFIATAIYSDNSKSDVTSSVTWTSSNEAAAGISNAAGSNGKAHGNAGGETTITASLAVTSPAAGSVSGSTTLSVTSASVASIAVTAAKTTIPAGIIQPFTATATLSDNTTLDLTSNATWSSSAASVATVSNDTGRAGWGTSVSPGSTTITATFLNISGSLPITVTDATLLSGGLSISPGDTTLPIGVVRRFAALGTFSDGNTYDLTTTVSWGSSVPAVATVSNAAGTNGRVTPAAAGTTDLTATVGGAVATARITVNNATVVSIALRPENQMVGLGIEPVQLTAIGTFSDGRPYDVTEVVTWKSSDTSIATVSNALATAGVATTAVAQGTATITATLPGSQSTAGTATTLFMVTAPQPVINSFSPDVGPVGQTVRVIGRNFVKGQTTVTIGGISGIHADTFGSTFLTFVIPGGLTGTGSFTITTPNGNVTSAGSYTVVAVTQPPTITALSPTSGQVGQIVTVTGSNFVLGNTTVTIGGFPVSANVGDLTGLSFQVPTGVTGSGPITVTTPIGSAVSTTNFTIGTPLGAPTITDVLPKLAADSYSYGRVGDFITVLGTNFVLGQTTVSVGGVSGVPTDVSDANSLGFFVPAGAIKGGSGKVTVTTPSGSAESANLFLVLY